MTPKNHDKPTLKHSGQAGRSHKFPAFKVVQGNSILYLFKADASTMFQILSINRRIEDKDEGYQRALSLSRVRSIANYIKGKHAIPGAIIASLDGASYNPKTGELTVPRGTDVGWVIDGQHRLAGAELAAREGTNIEVPVVAFLGLNEKLQVEQFVTINREGKNVPTSLYLELLKLLPFKKPGDAARERAADIGTQLRRDEESPFFEKIVVTVSPKAGQISLVNFVRKISPLVQQGKGMLYVYSQKEQIAVISNYYKGLREVFPKEFEKRETIFFKTIGFGALWNAFPTFFNLALKNQSGFNVQDVVAVFKKIESFDFSGWAQYGTGSQAEINAGEDLRDELLLAFSALEGGSLRL
jgi:DGQHR domain-containing protein